MTAVSCCICSRPALPMIFEWLACGFAPGEPELNIFSCGTLCSDHAITYWAKPWEGEWPKNT